MNRELSHLSSEDVSNWVLGGSTAEMEQHAGECLHCFEQVKRLETSLALFRESGKSWADHWCSYQAAGAVVGRRERAWVAVGVACAFAVAAIALILVFRQPPAKVASEQPFIALPYVAPPAPYERTEVLRMDVPVTMLMTAGHWRSGWFQLPVRISTGDPITDETAFGDCGRRGSGGR